jgi:hypothetical protein
VQRGNAASVANDSHSNSNANSTSTSPALKKKKHEKGPKKPSASKYDRLMDQLKELENSKQKQNVWESVFFFFF